MACGFPVYTRYLQPPGTLFSLRRLPPSTRCEVVNPTKRPAFGFWVELDGCSGADPHLRDHDLLHDAEPPLSRAIPSE